MVPALEKGGDHRCLVDVPVVLFASTPTAAPGLNGYIHEKPNPADSHQKYKIYTVHGPN